MTINRIVLERGIELRLNDGRWTISGLASSTSADFSSIDEPLTSLRPLRPVLMSEQAADGREIVLLLRSDNGKVFDLDAQDPIKRDLPPALMYPVHHLSYSVGALAYHCKWLADWYAKISIRFCEMQRIPGHPGSGDAAIYSYQTEPYYEFEALLSAARRSYDYMRYILWPRFGSGDNSMPRSFEKLLKAQSRLPDALRERLTRSWQTCGTTLADYRDCITHYVPVDFGLASAYMERHPVGGWTTMLRIPDNPKMRSKSKFKFELNHDALTYGWELSTEVLDVAMAVVDAAVPHTPNQD